MSPGPIVLSFSPVKPCVRQVIMNMHSICRWPSGPDGHRKHTTVSPFDSVGFISLQGLALVFYYRVDVCIGRQPFTPLFTLSFQPNLFGVGLCGTQKNLSLLHQSFQQTLRNCICVHSSNKVILAIGILTSVSLERRRKYDDIKRQTSRWTVNVDSFFLWPGCFPNHNHVIFCLTQRQIRSKNKCIFMMYSAI